MTKEKLQFKNQNLPKGWRKVKLGEIVDVYGGGTPNTSIPKYWGGNIAWLTPAEVVALNGNRFIDKTERYITDEGLKHSSAKLIPPNSLLLTSRATIGEVVINKIPMATNQGFINIIPKNVDLMFLFYWLKNKRKYLNQLAIGSTFNELSKSVFKKIEIELPEDINEQKRIADILSAFDDKIELNNKIIKTLEQMAQEIFKEWFVKFRFPGWEKVKFVDSELGKIPEGWEVRKIKNTVEIISRGPALTYVRGERDGIPVLNQRCIRNGEIELEAIQYVKPVKEIFYLRKWDILINSMGTGTLGRVSRNLSIDYPMIIHNCITFIRAHDPKIQMYLYYQLKNHEKYFEQIATGSTGQTSLTIEMIKELSVVLPSHFYLEQFFEKVEPMWEIVGRLKKENKILAALRDLLLPKLMSGEIRV